MPQSKSSPVLSPKRIERFWSLVSVEGPDDCWLWQGAVGNHGYGLMGGYGMLAHRISWQIAHGPIPEGMRVCHTCDNRPCCNPAHFFLGTDADNAMDKARKLRIPIAKLTPEIVREMRRRYAEGGISTRKLAAEYGVDRRAVVFALKGQTWTHVEGGEMAQLGDQRRLRRGQSAADPVVSDKAQRTPRPRPVYRRVPEETALAILADVASGMPKSRAAREHGVNRKTVDAILDRLKEAA